MWPLFIGIFAHLCVSCHTGLIIVKAFIVSSWMRCARLPPCPLQKIVLRIPWQSSELNRPSSKSESLPFTVKDQFNPAQRPKWLKQQTRAGIAHVTNVYIHCTSLLCVYKIFAGVINLIVLVIDQFGENNFKILIFHLFICDIYLFYSTLSQDIFSADYRGTYKSFYNKWNIYVFRRTLYLIIYHFATIKKSTLWYRFFIKKIDF